MLPNHVLEKMPAEERAKLGKAGITKAEAEAKFMARSERELQKQISNELLRRGIWFDRDGMHKRRTGTKGTPDFLFAIKGQAGAFEVKFGPGKLGQDQERAIAEMRANGWRVEVVYTLVEAIEILKEMGA